MLRQWVMGAQGHEKTLEHQVAPLQAGVVVARPGGVLEGQGEMQLTSCDAGAGDGGADFLDDDGDARVTLLQALHGGRDQIGERARECADDQTPAMLSDTLGELRSGQREPIGDRVGVLEENRALRRQRQSAGPTFQQTGADLGFKTGDLLRDRWLRQRERRGRTRKRPLASDGPERQQPPRVHRHSLWECENDDVYLWAGPGDPMSMTQATIPPTRLGPLTVSRLAFGCMLLGDRTTAEEAPRPLDRFLDAGGTLLDTADVYGDGTSERVLAPRLGTCTATKLSWPPSCGSR